MSESKGRVWCLFVAILATLMATAVDARELVAVGTAYTGDGDRLLYREFYYLYPNDGRAEVIYRNDNDRAIAEKVLHYGRTVAAPSFEQRDLRTGEILAAQWRGDTVRLSRRDAAGDSLQTRRIEPASDLVIDAGFDNFIRHHFQRLLDGRTLRFDFALPAHLTTVAMRVRRHSCEDGKGKNRVCFRVSAGNWMVRLLASSVDLEYDRTSRRLLTFRGVSNIAAADGGSQQVVIRYRYLPQLAQSK